MKSYSEAIKIQDYYQRFKYLKPDKRLIGEYVFGGHRELNQVLYKSQQWRSVRRQVILRDDGFDLAHPDHPIRSKLLVHHINPISIDDILSQSYKVFDLDNLILIDFNTHEALHFGDESLLPKPIIERKPGDTTLW